ncbi:MAG TPA: Ig-like domain-containing protein [Steroidobacteraceae bacterium]|nr:Ig-like domain-containing protein [Steroidobacteraceae bacterium]
MHKIASIFAVSALALALAACGGSDDKSFVGTGSSSGTGGSGSSSSGGSSSSAAAVAGIAAVSDTPSIANDGSQSANITALVRDSNNVLLQGVPVAFTASSGGVAVAKGTTDASGSATATLSTAGDPTLRTITVTATAGGQSATVQVKVVAATSGSTYQLGNGSGGSFQANAIAIGSTSLSAGASTGLQVSIVDQNGTLYTGQAVTITFNSPCVASGLATVTATGGGASPGPGQVSTTSGIASATYTAKGCSGSDTITATATVGSQNLTADATVSVAQASVGSIQFVSAKPTTIGLKGTGLGETSTVVFKVLDSTGGPVPNATVSFSLNTNVGGLSLAPASAVSAADGTVQTVVSSGTVHTVVRITASTASPALSTQSSQLTVTTGLPASNAFSIAVGPAKYGAGGVSNPPACPNVEAYGLDLVTVPVTVQLADRYNNPVPDGTSVAFTTNGGHIDGTCTTPLSTPGDGTCEVTWTSANPRPTPASNPPVLAPGRASVLATAIGEESFTDTNGNGFWDSSEPFVDLGEPFRDDNEDGVYQSGEYFLDFNHNGLRDAPDGSFKGITCTGNGAGASCSTTTWAIGVSHLIIMSTGGADILLFGTSPVLSNSGSQSSPSLTWATANGTKMSGSITLQVVDLNGNPVSAGSTISITSDNTSNMTVSQATSSYTVGCSTDGSGQLYNVNLTAVKTGSFANINVQVVSAGTKTLSLLSIPVQIN